MDYTKLNGADMLQELGDDASKWAAAFVQHFPQMAAHEDGVLGWFANAIEHSTDVRTGHIHNGDHMQYLLDRARPSAPEGE